MTYSVINTTALVVETLLLFWLWKRTGDIWSCANVFSVCFGLPVLGSQLWYQFTESAFQPTPETVLFLHAGWIAFLLGMAITAQRLPSHQPSTCKPSPIDPRKARPVLAALMLAHLAYTVAVINSTGLINILHDGQFGAIESLAANRLNAARDFSLSKVGWYFEAWHISYVYYVPLALYLHRQRQLSRTVLSIVWAFASVLSLALFSRVHFLMLLVFGLVAWAVLFRPSGRQIARIAGAIMCAAIALFVGMQSVLSRLDTNSKSMLTDQLATYAVSPALSFQELLNGNYPGSNPHGAFYTGEGIYYLLGKLSLLNTEDYPIGFRAFVFVPNPSNVYTFLDAFALDFGIAGIIIGPFVMGAAMAWVYNRVRIRATYPLVLLYALSVYSCSVANLANFLFTPPALIFLGTVFILRGLISAEGRAIKHA